MGITTLVPFAIANVESGIGWITLALINAGLAEAKDRDELGRGLGSLMLGPLATAAIVLVERGEPDARA